MFSSILAIIKAVPILDSWLQQFLAFYMAQQTNETLSMVADAAALASRAKSDEERYIAADAWRRALIRPRMS